MESKFGENEVVVKKLGEGWHVIRHGEKIEWLKTAYRRKLFRQPILTNQRLLFLKDGDIDSEIPLENIALAESKRYLRLGTPYLKLVLKNGSIVHMVFENISQRALDTVLGGGYSAEDTNAARFSKEWANEINRRVKDLETRQLHEAKTLPPPPPPPPTIAQICPVCGQPLVFIQQYRRWYCYNCKKYTSQTTQ